MAVATLIKNLDLMAEGTFRIRDAERFSGLGRSTLYKAIREGRLASCRVGRARRIPVVALKRLLNESLSDSE